MTANEQSDDVREIEAMIAQQLQSIGWSADKQSDWSTFAKDFLPSAALYPAARLVQSQTVAEFVERMQGVSLGDLKSFEQSMIGAEVHVFGKIAIAFGVCRNLENGVSEVRGVEAYLLVMEDQGWRIAAQDWDTEPEGKTIPQQYLRD